MLAATNCEPNRAGLHVVWLLVCVATLANGATFWLKRTGWLETPAYHDHLIEKAGIKVVPRSGPLYEEIQDFFWRTKTRLYAVAGHQVFAKLAKFGVVMLIVGVSLWSGWRARQWPPAATQPAVLGFAALVSCAALVSWLRFGGELLMPGMRAFAFLAVALAASRLASTQSLALFSNYLIVLVFVQLILVPLEMGWGLVLFAGKGLSLLPGDRVTGAFLQPTTLGLFSVIALTCYLRCADPSLRMRVLAAVAVGVVVIAAASAAALLLYLVVLGQGFARAIARSSRARWLVLLIATVALTLALPWLTGREEILTSVFGRMDKIQRVIIEAPGPLTLLFGEGLGVGTNAAVHWRVFVAAEVAELPSTWWFAGSDSTVHSLIGQIGLVGGAGFYALLAWAAWRDARARPLYAVIALASLAINIVELFPVNLLLGLLLAHSAGKAPAKIDKNTSHSG